MTCECPMTAGDLLAVGAVVQVHGPPQSRDRLARLCFEHARLHPTPKSESEADDDGTQNPR